MQTEKFGQESESLEDDDANINNDINIVNVNKRFKTVKFGFSFNFLHFSDSTKASNLWWIKQETKKIIFRKINVLEQIYANGNVQYSFLDLNDSSLFKEALCFVSVLCKLNLQVAWKKSNITLQFRLYVCKLLNRVQKHNKVIYKFVK